MDTVDRIQQNVLNGMVLDDEGKWVSLENRIDVEKKILDRLAQGRVPCEGRWIPILEAKTKKNGVAPPSETRTRIKIFRRPPAER
jgi:hypothetical protein